MTNLDLANQLRALAEKATPRPWQQRDDQTTEGWITIIGNVDGEYVDGQAHCTYDVVSRCEDEFGERLPNVGSNAALIVALRNNLPTILAALAEADRLREALSKATQPSWFYHPDYTEYCVDSPYEVVDDYYDPEPGKHVFVVECARPLPPIWCAVHCLTNAERDAMETDERFIMTEHATESEARTALEGGTHADG
jgi:hypothetical protein